MTPAPMTHDAPTPPQMCCAVFVADLAAAIQGLSFVHFSAELKPQTHVTMVTSMVTWR
jgi:hypothetical protein